MSARKLVSVVTLIKRRQARAAARKRSVSQRTLHAAALLLGGISLAAAVVALAGLPFYFFITQTLPPVERLASLLDPQAGELLQATHFVDRTGQHVLLSLEPPGGQRVFVDAADNFYLATAFVASQDPQYWEGSNRGWLDLDSKPRGIAEHLVARLLLSAEPESWIKTVRTRILAADALALYGQPQVLTWALNSAQFGYNTFGVESAAQLYFGKTVSQLSLAEAALLAAVAQAPALNPIDAPALAIEYQRLVLRAMRDQERISPAEYEGALAEEIVFNIGAASPSSLAPDFTVLAQEQAVSALGKERLQLGALTVVTTLDIELQEAAEAALADSGSEAAVLDPANGQILALVGPVNSLHAAASLRTPFLYLNVFALGQAPASLVWDLPESGPFVAAAYRGPLTMRQALAASLLAPVEGWLGQVGEDKIIELFGALGLESEVDQASVIQQAVAFGVLATNGILATQAELVAGQPSAILFVGDAQDRVVLNWTIPTNQSITSPELAYLVTDVLADASLQPSSRTPVAAGRPLARFQATEAGEWSVAYSPQRSVVMWSDEGMSAVDELFDQLLDAAHETLPIRTWESPAGVTSLVVCVPSGQLPDEDCPQTRREVFISGTEPAEYDALYQRLALNSTNGKLATVFTPAEFVQEKVFMQLPPEAVAWARRAGFELPPEDYDSVSVVELQSGPLWIALPDPFSEVSGIVELVAVLPEGATAYDFQVGSGLRPTEWMLVAEGEAGRMVNVDAEWDSTGLSGVWAIQIQAWDEAGVVRRAYAIVTISTD